MGEIAEMMLDGTLCQGCGVFLGDECGYPRSCDDCARQQRALNSPPAPKVMCPECGKRFKPVGLADHRRDKHSI